MVYSSTWIAHYFAGLCPSLFQKGCFSWCVPWKRFSSHSTHVKSSVYVGACFLLGSHKRSWDPSPGSLSRNQKGGTDHDSLQIKPISIATQKIGVVSWTKQLHPFLCKIKDLSASHSFSTVHANSKNTDLRKIHGTFNTHWTWDSVHEHFQLQTDPLLTGIFSRSLLSSYWIVSVKKNGKTISRMCLNRLSHRTTFLIYTQRTSSFPCPIFTFPTLR